MDTQLLHHLPAEQARCRELLRHYVTIGSTGAFATALIEQSLKRADRAVIEGDESDIRRALVELRRLTAISALPARESLAA